ncbi:FtsQ-type POTRA domain-containing protein [Eubacteriaceae bacterium ES3]|nr:FtsQ-type POTRA domain-containing protein [Eubacteriaceae bacterium ES3]
MKKRKSSRKNTKPENKPQTTENLEDILSKPEKGQKKTVKNQKKPQQSKTLSREERRKQKRKELKSRKRKRIARWLMTIITILVVLGLIGFGFVQAMRLGVFDIAEIEVVGNEIVDTDAVVNASGINLGDSIFFVDLNQANYNINEIMGLDELEISKIFPNKILIRMVEKDPIGVINFDDKLYYLDRDGNLIENSEYLRKTDIPIIYGVGTVTADSIGRSVEVDPYWRFNIVLRILNELDSQGYLSKISEIRITTDNTYEILTKSGTVFIVWDYSNYQENEAYIYTNLDKNTSNMSINLTTGNQPIVKAR